MLSGVPSCLVQASASEHFDHQNSGQQSAAAADGIACVQLLAESPCMAQAWLAHDRCKGWALAMHLPPTGSCICATSPHIPWI